MVKIFFFSLTLHRPHPNECSGGDLDGDLFFVSWDTDLIPPRTAAPMDYIGRRPRIMDHDVTLEVISEVRNKNIRTKSHTSSKISNRFFVFGFAGNSEVFC